MCLDDTILVRLLTQDASPSQLADWRKHIEHCESCTRRFADLRSTWDELGSWEVSAPQADATAAILAAASRQSQATKWTPWMRVAAAILIATGSGWLAGRLTPHSTAHVQQVNQISVENVSSGIGLTELGQDLNLLEPIFASAETETDASTEERS